MNFNDLNRTADFIFTECELDFEPSFVRQAEAVRQWESAVQSNIDSMASLHRSFLSVESDQSELEGAVLLIGESLAKLEQSITRLERCPQEVGVLPSWRTSANSNASAAGSQQGYWPPDRNRFYRMLLEMNGRMGDPDRDWPPDANVLKQQMADHRRWYEEHFPIIGVLACHVETLAAIEKQLDATEDRLTANGILFREIGLHGDRWLDGFCCNLLEDPKK